MLRFSASADIGAKAALRALHDLVADFLHHWMHVFFGYTEQQGGCFQWERLGAQAAMIRFESGTALLFQRLVLWAVFDIGLLYDSALQHKV